MARDGCGDETQPGAEKPRVFEGARNASPPQAVRENAAQGLDNDRIHRSLTGFLILRFAGITPGSEIRTSEMRARYAFLEAWVSIVGNLVLALTKVVLGLLLNSISLLADAAHTASDVLTSVVVLLGFRIAKAPADEKHPFGHGRAEFLSTLVIAVLLILVGLEFGKSSYGRLLANIPVKGSIPVAVVMVLSALAKEWMTRFAIYLGQEAKAQALIGDAWHHRTDAIASLLVAVAVIASGYGYHKVDAIFGLLVSALIVYTGIELALSSSSVLLGERADPGLIQAIKDAAINCEGVKGLHKIAVHDYGDRKAVSLHILVSDDISLLRSHEIASEVERAVRLQVPGDIVVHVEPKEEEDSRLSDDE